MAERAARAAAGPDPLLEVRSLHVRYPLMGPIRATLLRVGPIRG